MGARKTKGEGYHNRELSLLAWSRACAARAQHAATKTRQGCSTRARSLLPAAGCGTVTGSPGAKVFYTAAVAQPQCGVLFLFFVPFFLFYLLSLLSAVVHLEQRDHNEEK